MPTPADSSPAPGPRRVDWDTTRLGCGLIVGVLGLAALGFPAAPDVDLDPSWRMTLGWALAHDVQFGPELVFTYGPLGYLMSPIYDGLHFWSVVSWQLTVAALFAGLAVLTVRPLRPAGRWIGYAYFLVYGTSRPDVLYPLGQLLFCLYLLREARSERRWLAAAGGAVLAWLSLMKFTHLMLAGVALAVLAGHDWREGRRSRVGLLLGGFALTFVGVWTALGQNPLNIPEYLWSSVQVSAGYVEAMGLDETGALFGLGVATLGLLAADLGLVVGLSAPDRRQMTERGLLLAAASFLAWKQGFVRTDGHAVIFFLFALGIAVLGPALAGEIPRWQRGRDGLRLVTAGCALAGAIAVLPWQGMHLFQDLGTRLRVNLTGLVSLPVLPARHRAQWAATQQQYPLPRTRVELDQRPVDVLGFSQGWALLNGLNYRPRPVFQSYSAYSAALCELNERFYAAATAPDFVLQRYQTIDHRFPTLDDAGALRLLFRDYQYAFEEGANLVWRRRLDGGRRDNNPQLLREATVRFGESFQFGEQAAGNLWVEIDYRPSLLGRLRALLYKPPATVLRVTDTTGQVHRFRLLRQVAGRGFLLSPLWRDQTELLRSLAGAAPRRLAALAVELPDGAGPFFQTEVRIRLAKIPGELIEPAVSDELFLAGEFKNFPRTLTAHAALTPVVLGTRRMLVVHAPSAMGFRKTKVAARLQGRFGMLDGTWQDPQGHSNGAAFRVVWKPKDGAERTLFARELHPYEQSGDRGLQPLEVDLAGLGEGQVRLVVDSLGDKSYDWTCWGGIELTPPEPLPRESGRARGDDHLWTKYGRFQSFPLAARSEQPLSFLLVGGATTAEAHAPGELDFDLPAGAKRLTGSFGIQDGAFSGRGNSDGVTFIVQAKSATELRELYRRYLNPRDVPADRGLHRLDVDLAGVPPGELLLITDPGPNKDASWDWSGWAEVEIR